MAQAGTWNMGGQACPPIDLTEVPRHVPRPALTTLSTLRESLLTTVGYSVLTTPPFPQFLPEDMFDMYVVGTQVPQGGGCLRGIAPGAGRTAARTQAADARLPSPSFTFINLVCRSDAVCSALKSREAVTLCRSRRAGISAPYSSCGNFRRTRMCGRG